VRNFIASGGPQPWYASAQVAGLFGGTPSAQQQAQFDAAVLQRVEQTFQQSGVNVHLTSDPGAAALHTLSLVSGATSRLFPGSIGTTDIGGSGFSFVDPQAKSVQSVDQLEWVVAHNVAHELMLAFGVPEKYDQTGSYVDATNASWSMMTSPSAVFSPAAAQALNQAIQAQDAPTPAAGAQFLDAQPVPEPAAILAWGVAAAIVVAGRACRKRTRRA
jgi:hypothetical protein